MLVCGIDEAGKGPVLGSLVICGVVCNDLKKLQKLKVADSKILTRKKREELYDKIIRTVKDYKVIVIEPEEIDSALENPALNLNKLELIKTKQILEELNPDKAYIDCPDVNTERYKEGLGRKNLIVEHKAEKYEVVAAASIIAKVIRDRQMDELKKLHKVEFGSGYCSDPATKKFLDEHWDNKLYHHIIRKNWMTFKNKVKEKEQTSLGQFNQNT